jgi:hypothetical protein
MVFNFKMTFTKTLTIKLFSQIRNQFIFESPIIISNTKKHLKMTKVITVVTVALFSIGVMAQETKPATKEKAKKESCCKKTSTEKKDKKSCCVKK